DLVVLGVNHVVATPFPDVGRLEHAAFFPRAVFAYSSTLGHESQTTLELAARGDGKVLGRSAASALRRAGLWIRSATATPWWSTSARVAPAARSIRTISSCSSPVPAVPPA